MTELTMILVSFSVKYPLGTRRVLHRAGDMGRSQKERMPMITAYGKLMLEKPMRGLTSKESFN